MLTSLSVNITSPPHLDLQPGSAFAVSLRKVRPGGQSASKQLLRVRHVRGVLHYGQGFGSLWHRYVLGYIGCQTEPKSRITPMYSHYQDRLPTTACVMAPLFWSCAMKPPALPSAPIRLSIPQALSAHTCRSYIPGISSRE